MVFANSSRRKSVASSSAAVARSGSGFELRPITSGATLREPENADSLVDLQSEAPGTKEFLAPGGVRTSSHYLHQCCRINNIAVSASSSRWTTWDQALRKYSRSARRTISDTDTPSSSARRAASSRSAGSKRIDPTFLAALPNGGRPGPRRFVTSSSDEYPRSASSANPWIISSVIGVPSLVGPYEASVILHHLQIVGYALWLGLP